MANRTVNLSVTKANYLQRSQPYTVVKANTSTEYYVDYDASTLERKMLLGIASMPSNLRHNVLVGWSLTIGLKNTNNLQSYVMVGIAADFDENTANYSNSGSSVGHAFYIYIPEHTSSITNKTSDTLNSGGSAKSLLRNKALMIQCGDVIINHVALKTVLANGTTKAYVTVTYDDSAKIKSKISYNNSQLTGTISNAVAKTLTWSLVEDTSAVSGYCVDPTWAQTSAVFYYRKQGESAWQSRTVSGATTSITIPANTFQSGKTYEYKITATDEDGTVSSTNTYTFTTAPTKVTPSNAPTSGYSNPRNSIFFGWTYQSTAGGTVPAGATTLYWRVSGSDTWNEVPAEAGVTSVTIPANTFPTASTIQWYLSGTDSTGYASQTSVYSFSTAAGEVTTDPISPKNTVESNNTPITFIWEYSSPDGFQPLRQELMWKLVTDDSWTTIATLTNGETSYTVPANTFPAGELRWGVNPYNIDNVHGTGHSTTFISYGAPETPTVYAAAVPFTTVTWQASDQQAYKIRVDDIVYGPYFGTEKSFTVPDMMEDGEHTIGVSVVGTYALWSEWGTSIINVQNVPGGEIVLGGNSGVDNFLSWTTAEETSDFLVFRDNVQIGRTAEISFTDRYAVGEHAYKVINRLPSGNYSESNEVLLNAVIDGTYISLLSGGEWLKIKYQLKDASDQEYTESIETVYNHLAGDDYPSVSISRYRERSLSYSAVFLYVDEEDHARFKDMLRKPIIMKFENGNVIVGVVDSWSVLHRKNYYTAYTFSLRRIEWEDYVDDTT